MSAENFYQLPEDDQVERLGRLARSVLKRWSLQDADIRPIAYRENMTFGIDAGSKGRFALRVHQAGYRSDAQVQSELDFMDHLNAQGILTPQVVPARDGSSFVCADHADVKEPRQCDLFEWIDGHALRKSGELPDGPFVEAARRYAEVGRLAASVYNASEKWIRPQGFERAAWDAEGLFGENGHLGNFRKIEKATDAQRELLDVLADRLARDLEAHGKAPDRYGLSQGDLLSENIIVCDKKLRLIDFDDAGDSWMLFDAVTACFDLKLLGSDYFEPCVQGFVDGFRELRALPEEHVDMLPAFFLARLLSYLAHTVSRSHLEQSAWMQPLYLAKLEEHGDAYLRS